MIFIIVLSLVLLPGTDHNLETCSAAPHCNLNSKLIIYKSRVRSSVPLQLTEEAPLLVFSPCYALCLGHFEFETLLTSSSAFSNRPNLCHQTIQLVERAESAQASVFGTKNFLLANLQAAISTAGFLRILPKSSFKKLLLGTGLWHHAKMSISLSLQTG